MDKYLSTKQACEFLGIKDFATLYSYIKEGKLKAHKLGGEGENSKRHWRIKLEDLEAFISGKSESASKEENDNELSPKVSV